MTPKGFAEQWYSWSIEAGDDPEDVERRIAGLAAEIEKYFVSRKTYDAVVENFRAYVDAMTPIIQMIEDDNDTL